MFGSGIRYHICQIPLPVFEKIKTLKRKYSISYEELFFDLEFINKLGFSHWSEFYCVSSKKGFFINAKNKIEIRKKNKLLKRFLASELLNKESLFTLYQTSITKQHFNLKSGFVNVILMEYEIGMIFNFQLNEQALNIEDLEFSLLEDFTSNNNYFLIGLNYKNKLLFNKKEDTVSRTFKILIK